MANPLDQLYPNKDALRVGATLGDLLTGNVGTKGLREDTLMNTYKLELALQQAREKRGDAIRSVLSAETFQALPQNAAALRFNPRDVYLQQAGAHNSNASQLGEALLKSNELGVRQKVATLGDMNEQNRLLASLGNPLKINDVSGGVVTNSYQTDAPVTLTPLGTAQVAEKQSQGVANEARAEASRASAAKSNRVLPKKLTPEQIARYGQTMLDGGMPDEKVAAWAQAQNMMPEIDDTALGSPPKKTDRSNRPTSVDANAKLHRMDGSSSEMAKLKAQATEAIRNNPAAEKQIIAKLRQEIQRRKLKE